MLINNIEIENKDIKFWNNDNEFIFEWTQCLNIRDVRDFLRTTCGL